MRMETRRILAAAFALAGATASGARAADWADFLGSDDNPGKYQTGTRAAPSHQYGWTTPSFRWSYSTTVGESSPAIAGGFVYLGAGSAGLRCWNAATGSVSWTTPSGAGAVSSPPCVAGGLVYAQTDGGTVTAWDRTSGAVVWQTAVDSPGLGYGGPIAAVGNVYVGTMPGSHVHGMVSASGAPIWSVTVDSSVFAAPSFFGGSLFEVSESTVLYAMNPATGATMWSHAPSDLIYGSPTAANGMVWFGAGQNQSLYAYNIATGGGPAWTRPVGSGISATAAYDYNTVFVPEESGKMWAVDGLSGSVVWTYSTGAVMHSSPALGNAVVFATGAHNKVWAWDRVNGQMLWTYALPYSAYVPSTAREHGRWGRSSLAVTDDALFVPSTSGNALVVLDWATTPIPTATPSLTPTVTPVPASTVVPSGSTRWTNAGAEYFFDIPAGKEVRVDVYSSAGEWIRHLVRETSNGQPVRAYWNGTTDDGAPASSGVYVIRVAVANTPPLFRRLAWIR